MIQLKPVRVSPSARAESYWSIAARLMAGVVVLVGLLACVPNGPVEDHHKDGSELRDEASEESLRVEELEAELTQVKDEKRSAEQGLAVSEARALALEQRVEELASPPEIGTDTVEPPPPPPPAIVPPPLPPVMMSPPSMDMAPPPLDMPLPTVLASDPASSEGAEWVLGEATEPEAAESDTAESKAGDGATEVEVFYGTNRARASGLDLSRLWLVLVFVVLFFLLPPLFRRLLKSEFERWAVWGTRALFGLGAVVVGFMALKSVLVQRQELGSGQIRYGNERRKGGGYEMGTCVVSIPPIHEKGMVERPKLFELVRDPALHLVLAEVDRLDEQVFLEQLRERVNAASEKDLFIFVHGYHNTFEDAAFRTAQMHHDLGFGGAPVFFSWPSQAGNYLQSERNVPTAVKAFRDFLETILENTPETTRIHLLAHSMGSRVLTQAVEGIVRPAEPKFVDQLVLAAPDIDLANFGVIAEKVKSASAGVALLASSKDTALLTSQWVHGGDPRAGQAPPTMVVAGVETFDVSDVSSGHSYIANSGRILGHLRFLLTGEGESIEAGAERVWLDEDQTLGYWVLH